MKSILFYVPPIVTNSDPYFYNGAVKKRLLPIANQLVNIGHEVHFCIPEVVADNVLFPSKIKVKVIDEKDFIHDTGVVTDLDYEIYSQNDIAIDNVYKYYKNFLQEEHYDLIIAWENCLTHLKKVFPNTPILNLMPGFVSRLPYPDLVYFDTLGLFKESKLYVDIENIIKDIELSDNNIAFLNSFTSKLSEFYANQTWVEELLNKTKNYSNYSQFVLLPLQYTKHYAYRCDCKKDNFELMVDILNNIDDNTGVIVTQYCTNTTSDKIITKDNISYLQNKYPNLIFNPNFDTIDNISQYLLPFVNKVMNCSSSLALQALLFDKDVEILCDTHLSRIIELSKLNKLNKLKILYWLLFRASIYFPFLLESKNLDLIINHVIDGKEICLDNLFEEYSNILLNAFRFERANQRIGKVNIENNNVIIEALKDRIEKAKIVSFDIFETLIERPLAQPTDLFLLVEKKLLQSNEFPRFAFAKERVKAEQIAKEIYTNEEKNEITIDEIYQVLADKFSLSDEVVFKLKGLELDTEFELMNYRPTGKLLYDYCKKIDKKVIFISDMYLNKDFIYKLLEKVGYDNDTLYLSSEVLKKKSDGELFKYVLKEEDITPKQMLHIGDNNNGDFNIPKSLGISAYRLVRSVDKMYNHELFGEIFTIRGTYSRSLGESVFIYLLARKNFDNPELLLQKNTFTNGSAYLFGYNIFAATILGFVAWIYQQRQIKNYDSLFFMARDGRILKEVYEILYPLDNIPSTYMYASRKLMRYCSIPSIEEFFTELGDLQGTIPYNLIKEIWDLETTSPNLKNKITSFSEEFSAVDEIKEEFTELLQQIHQKNDLLLKYSKKIGINQSKNPCVIDIGYRGTLQYYLSKSLNLPLNGLYFCLFDRADYYSFPGGSCFQYLSDENYHQKEIPHLIANNGFLYETIFCSEEDTIIGLREHKTNIRAIRNHNPLDKQRKLVIQDIHKGIRDFARDFCNLLGKYRFEINFSPMLTEKMVKAFLDKPSGRDAGIFEGVIFESNFQGENYRYIIPRREMKKEFQNNKIYAIWKNGSEVFFRRGDLFPANAKQQINNEPQSEALSEQKTKKLTEDEDPPAEYSNSDNRFERWLISRIVKDYRKLRKYEENPKQFFADSKNPLVRWYEKIR